MLMFITPVSGSYLVSSNNTKVYNVLLIITLLRVWGVLMSQPPDDGASPKQQAGPKRSCTLNIVTLEITKSRMKDSEVGADKKNAKKPEALSKRKETIEREGSVKEGESNRGLSRPRKEAPVGILRLDSAGKRRSPLDIRLLAQGEPPSPQPSVDRLSVTFAEDSVRSDSSTRINLYIPQASPQNMDKVHFPTATDAEDSDEEDYSASVNAIIQRKASQRRSRKRSSRRRASSPFSPDILPGPQGGRRRSSVFTTSSGDTAITVDESPCLELTQEQIFENIRLHKEVLSSVRMQPWNMRKKLKLVMQAKNYVKRHEGALQERFTQTHSLKNMLARWNIYLIKKWQHYRREMANLSNWLIPWEKRIKAIESHFGSVVASYFIFLRWLFWVNVVTSAILVAFVAVPEIITVSDNDAIIRKQILPEDKYNATNFLTLWDFEGILKYTPLFYGWYSDRDKFTGYRLPLAYFMTELIVYVYSFVATLRKMAENSRMSKLSEKDDECIFTWKLFTGWDYMIGNPETAQNRVMSVVTSFKEALLEEAEKKRKDRNWKLIWTRVLVNLLVLALFALSAAAVVYVVKRSTEDEATSTGWRRNETTVVMTLISFICPMILEFLGFMEQYHPRKQLRIQLARIMMLNLLNLYSLIFAQFDRISDMSDKLLLLKPNNTSTHFPINTGEGDGFTLTTALMNTNQSIANLTNCHMICYNVTSQEDEFTITDLITSVSSTVATTAFPKLWSTISTAAITTESSPFIEYGSTSSYFNESSKNLTLFESPCCGHDTSNLNFTLNSSSLDMLDVGNDAELLENRLKDKFEDYLRYILESVLDLLNGNSTTFKNLNESYINRTEILNETDTNLTAIWQESTTYDYFKTTIAPIFNTTPSNFNEKLEKELTILYNQISTTISDIEEIVTQSRPWEKCEDRCETFPTSVYSTHRTPLLTAPTFDLQDFSLHGNYTNRTKLRSLCWETMFGQELVKLTVMDLVFTVGSIIGIDFVRGIFVRVMNRCCCWDLEKKFPEYGEFKVAENILHLVNNQGMVWMGMFFSPGLILLNVIKLILLMYLRSWAVLTCNVPHAVIFRASRSNNFYFALLLTMLFLCVLPVGYAIVWVKPSWHCGPFSAYPKIYNILTDTIRNLVPEKLHIALDYIVSPGIVIPLLVLLILIIYYLISLTNSLREANADLKIQLRQERTEERRKMFQIADRRRRGGSGGSGELENTPFGKWKKLIGTLPTGKSTEDTSKSPVPSAPPQNGAVKTEVIKTRDLVSKFIRRALRKPSVTSEEESAQAQDDATDTEQPDSLPEDASSYKEVKPQVKITANKGKNFTIASSKSKQILHRVSTDSTDGKHVQIAETTPEVYRRNSQPAKESFDGKKKEELRQKRRSQSPTRSSSSKDTRHDSITSNWSENIPVITISKTESAECILEQHTENSNKIETGNTSNGESGDTDALKTEDPGKVSSSTDTLVGEEESTLPKIKNVLKKQTVVTEKDDSSDGVSKDSSGGLHIEESEEESTTKTTVRAKVLEKSSTSGTSDTTKTESSADYKDKSFS